MNKSIALIPAMMVAAAALPAMAQAVPAASRMDGPPLLSLSVTENVEAAPDVATVSTGVESRAPSASEAMSANARDIDRLVAAIKGAGIDAKDIQTSGINLSPQYVYGQKGPDGSDLPPKFVGYTAHNMLTVKSRNIAKLGGLLDKMVAAGATNINGPNFEIDKPQPLADRARMQAIATGKARAELYAKAAGYRSVRLVAVAEGGAMPPPPPAPVMFAQRDMAAAAPVTKIEPGQVTTSITLSLQYALEN